MTAKPRELRVLVVDDEELNRQRVLDLLASEPGIGPVTTAVNGAEAIDRIRADHPDLVFLDVQMPGKTGLDVVRELGEAMPATVFVTAHDQHALAAFDLAAVDYLVKPFDDERFEQALQRARRLIELEDVERLRTQLLAALQAPGVAAARDMAAHAAGTEEQLSPGALDTPPGQPQPPAPAVPQYLERIPVETRGKVIVVQVSEIEYIVASGPYAELRVGDRKHLIREAMQTLEERLDPARFIRVHRSIIVRLDLVNALLRGSGGDYEVQLRTGARLKVSRSRREELERRMGITA
ncbi:MAG: response regulator transcription factor [Gemmatimonadaceae bacterium]|nr:response regulator transcription factor [Gemmatimonadaceae bacterium]